MEGKNIQNSEKTVSKSHNSTSDKIPVKKALKTIAVSSIFSFFISEVLFLYFLKVGISKFPENLIVCLAVLSIVLGLQARFFTSEIRLVTLFTSAVTLTFIVNYLFGSSTNPSIFYEYIFQITPSAEDAIFIDYGVFGFIAPPLWLIFLDFMYNLLIKARKISMRQAYLTLHTKVSRVVDFFDKHPWFVTGLISLIALLVGILIGTGKG